MKYSVITISPFDRQLKRLIKKYPSLKKEYADLLDNLEKSPNQGTPLGNNCYKIRISIGSKGKGKSGGARVITHFIFSDNIIFLLAIYDKSDQISITNKELDDLLKQIT